METREIKRLSDAILFHMMRMNTKSLKFWDLWEFAKKVSVHLEGSEGRSLYRKMFARWVFRAIDELEFEGFIRIHNKNGRGIDDKQYISSIAFTNDGYKKACGLRFVWNESNNQKEEAGE